ncbi:hypothetical protein [Thalassoglobus polymorphus]|uniref:Uncharacterized protein n=1 Tax=Thalassoglobus polymorphus TaxID=2527994 RepID=A0A517QMS5_9PLAN|nr:hypothetical protein [Thalassoglobus polymorphus]QDT32938.1 hypothetical protein Mal48_21870 [Thalassoglobus polymorphus]
MAKKKASRKKPPGPEVPRRPDQDRRVRQSERMAQVLSVLKVISRIEKEASIVVEQGDEKAGRSIKYAYAHDLMTIVWRKAPKCQCSTADYLQGDTALIVGNHSKALCSWQHTTGCGAPHKTAECR